MDSRPFIFLSPRKLLRILTRGLRRKQRFSIQRSVLKLDLNPSSRLSLKLAETKEEFEAAFRILHDEYVHAGFMKPDSSGLRVTSYHALPSTSVLIAKWDQTVVGTVSVVRDSAFGFPLNKIFATKHLRGHGSRLAEISSLAIRRDFRRNRGAVLFPLLKFIHNYCRRYFGIDYLIIAVNPRHVEFYESILGFTRFSESAKSYDFVNGAPAVGAYLDLRNHYKFLIATYGCDSSDRNLFYYFYELELPNIEFPKRSYFKVEDPVMTPELMDYFFNRRTRVFQNLSDRDRAIVRALYPYDKFQSYLPKVINPEQLIKIRSEVRFDVNCRGRVHGDFEKVIKITVFNVSLNGFQARPDTAVELEMLHPVSIEVGDFVIADLVASPVWKDSEGRYGFHINQCSYHWREFIKHLERDPAVAKAS
jgi:hypothetical protein